MRRSAAGRSSIDRGPAAAPTEVAPAASPAAIGDALAARLEMPSCEDGGRIDPFPRCIFDANARCATE